MSARAMMETARNAARTLGEAGLPARLVELHELMHRLRDRQEEVVERIMADTGKTRTDALVSEVLGTLDCLHWLVSKGPRYLEDEKASTPLALMGKKSRIWYEPLGVVLVITPWNYPFHISLTGVATALLAGNSVILKPSEHTPLKGLLEELLDGLPLLASSVQVAYGEGDMAEALIDAGPDKIVFTGSAPTGRKILRQAAEQFIPVELELGGKDAMIVFDDVDLKRTAAGALWGALTNSGQSCTSVERLYVHRSIHDDFVAHLRQELDRLVLGQGDDGNADLGAMTTSFQYDIVQRHLADAREKGATIHGGQGHESERMITPALVTGVTPEMALMKEETFGPVLPVVAFDDEDEVTREANSLPYGLSASVWSRDLRRAERVARALRVGAVSINNVMLTEGNPALPFGGVGESGYGRTKGVEGLRAMCRSKAVLIDKQSGTIEANWYPYTREKYRLFTDLIRGLFSRGLSAWVRFARAGLKLESHAQKPRDSR